VDDEERDEEEEEKKKIAQYTVVNDEDLPF
jgi:hypothetical protein